MPLKTGLSGMRPNFSERSTFGGSEKEMILNDLGTHVKILPRGLRPFVTVMLSTSNPGTKFHATHSFRLSFFELYQKKYEK